MIDIIIIGAGPAGLTAAIYALRAGKNVKIFESLTYGGQIINAKEIENYPGIKNISGIDYANNLYEQVKALKTDITNEKVIKIRDLGNTKKVITEDNEYEAKAIIIATGAKNKTLDLPNEKELIGKGISYCATCDGAFYKDKDVAVIGGGNTAISDALYLSNYCNKVNIIYRKDKFKADALTVSKLQEKNNVTFIFNTIVTDLIADNKLSKINIKNTKTEKSKTMDIDGLFVAVGHIPNNEYFKDLIDLDENGYIKTDNKMHTNIKGIYAAGDITKKDVRQLTTATSDGTIAALTAVDEL